MFNEQTILSDFKSKLENEIEKTRSELVIMKSGRANPGMVENLMVEAYAGSTKLKMMEMATITTEGPSGLLISPFDPSVVSDIEKAILTSPLHLTPRVDGKNIHIKIPALSEEQRRELLKTVSQEVEKGKSAIRFARDEVRRKIKTAFEAKEISEDQKFRIEKEIDKITHDHTERLDEMKEKKEKEMMEV